MHATNGRALVGRFKRFCYFALNPPKRSYVVVAEVVQQLLNKLVG